MLTLPTIVANPPVQPFYPTAALRGITGMAAWLTLHESTKTRNPSNGHTVRPRAGSVGPFVSDPVGNPAYLAHTFPNGNTFSVFNKTSTVDGNYWQQPISLSAGWNTIVAVEMQRSTNTEAWAILPTGTTDVQISWDPRHSSSVSELSHRFNATLNGAPVPLNAIGLHICAVNFATGAAKISIDGGAPTVGTISTLPALAVVEGQAGALAIGARQRNSPLDGLIAEIGHIRGDLLADAAGLAVIRDYAERMYGVA